MLVKPLPDSEEEGHDNQEAHQKYEAMQCFAVSQPKSIKEEGEGRTDPGRASTWCLVTTLVITGHSGSNRSEQAFDSSARKYSSE